MFQKRYPAYTLFIFLILNISFWLHTKDIQNSWSNVPFAPSKNIAALNFGGDNQLAYRVYASVLQNSGSVDGKDISLKKYNYNILKDWFFLSHELDSRSDVVPLLAAYYYGGINDPEKLSHILDYLLLVGRSSEGEKWRWLGHAVYIARHQMQDNDKALELAYLLASNKSPDLADWARQMPAFILNDQGNNDLAYKIMLNLLISNADTLHPNELFFMQEYICTQILPSMEMISPPEFCHNFNGV